MPPKETTKIEPVTKRIHLEHLQTYNPIHLKIIRSNLI